MTDIPPFSKPNRADFTDARAYKSAYEKWRYLTVPGAKERAIERSARSRKNDPFAAEKRRAWENGRYQNDEVYREKILAKNRKYASDNLEYTIERNRKYQRDHKEELKLKRAEYFRKYSEDNQEKVREKYRRHYEADPDYYQVKSRLRQIGLLKATPKWLTKEQKSAISAIYREARKLTKLTGVKHVVDHICALNGKNSCGLHVPWNLRVVAEADNLRKGNRNGDE